VKWYQPFRTAEEVLTLRQRATILRYTYAVLLLIWLSDLYKLFAVTLLENHVYFVDRIYVT
jgi:hypothetical protein